jgi:hypothetical protein
MEHSDRNVTLGAGLASSSAAQHPPNPPLLAAQWGAAIATLVAPFFFATCLFEGITLKKVEEYRGYAAECRDMARTAPLTHRQQLQHMAQIWEQLAQECRKRDDAENDGKGLVIEFKLPKESPKRP